MTASQCWGWDCDECGTGDDGYETEIAALRAEITHMESPDCDADPDDVREKREELAALELEASSG